MELQRSEIQKYGLDLSGSGQGQVLGTCECGKEPQSSIKCQEFLNYLRTVSFSGKTLLNGVIQLVCQLDNNRRLPLQTTKMPAHITINTNGSLLPDWNATKHVEYFASQLKGAYGIFCHQLVTMRLYVVASRSVSKKRVYKC